MDCFDRFSIFFSGDKLIAGRRTYPLGEITTELLNLKDEWFVELQKCTDNFVPAAREMLESKNEKAALNVQERLNAVWDLLLELPPYRDISLDIRTAYHLFPVLVSDSEKWQEATTPGTGGRKHIDWFLDMMGGLSQNLLVFLNQVDATLTLYFEPLGKRTKDAYGFAFTHWYMDALKKAPIFSPDADWEVSTEVAIEFVPVNNLDETHRPVIAEKLQFNSLVSFLYADFYRGLIHGNCPRRCHNCGKYFLLTAGYNTCYCNNIAPGETSRTCRKVGAHNKAEKEKASETPAQREYRKAYNRLKVRKNRKKISNDEWNKKVAQAQEWKELAEQGKLSDSELREKLAGL
ncbi:hypothetical protein D1841_15430 [Neglecta sp. X4]|uniref:DUF6076 domain-containing protein n=1 Tax=unclassified Neglectibacter TaxID=2632164 RepID=UPI001371AA5C|nr:MULTISPECIES: DUF6076 domain-containing protein [unclassified Neglectibacter]NBI18920.1 hypothetical protein [Neglectibacter sp. 59]NBJ74593.1 hypothetical protein [Neglectibacter sp. X4]NCE81529.1 hypothetical protein [Neglectibacter sp. X58]